MFNMMHVSQPQDANDASAIIQAGQLVYHNGGIYRYVKNNEASTALAANDACIFDTTNMGSVKKLPATTQEKLGAFCGVAIGAITAQKYGFIHVGGKEVACLIKGTVAAGDPLSASDTAGKLRKSADNGAGAPEAQVGVALEAGTDAALKIMIMGRV